MELNWSNVKDEELRAILASINTELTERDKAKARRLIRAIDKAINDFLSEYPTACWMIDIEDEDGYCHEINLFNYDLDTNLIDP